MTEVRRNVRTYQGLDRTPVEVLIEGRGWVAGEVRIQWQDAAGASWAEVQFRSTEHNSTMIDSFPAELVRPDEGGQSFQTGDQVFLITCV